MSDRTGNAPIKPAAPGTNAIIKPTPFTPPETARVRSRPRISTGAVAVATVLAACIAAAWFILTARSVYVQTEPGSARVEISGGFSIKLADRFLMRSGEYRVHISATGYHPIEAALTVGTDQNQQFDYEMRPLPGHLRLSVAPSSGTRVSVDGAEPITTPPVIRGLEAGEHRVRIEADRYLPFEQTVEIEGRDREQALVATLEPAWADITVSSDPEGAEIVIDDTVVGTTPMTAEVMQGEHELRVQLSGYKSRQRELTARAGEARTLDPFVLEPADAVVMLDSKPDGANVTVNGEYRGRTPLEIALDPGTQASIRLFREGYRPATRAVTLESGVRQQITIDLQAELMPVEFLVEPADAELFINGRSHGRAGGTLQLPTRAQKIRISKSGYVDYETTITPRPGIAQQIRVSLKTLEQARLESIKPMITTAAGQTMRLFRPNGPFTMGASRREPGRRANETFRSVVLKRPFYLSEKEVSNAEFRKFRPDHSSGSIKGETLDDPRQPVANITWADAVLYCNWLSARDQLKPFYKVSGDEVTGFDGSANGYRLPTEAEWAWAARNRGSGDPRRFPWGAELPPPPKSGNYADRSAASLVNAIISGYQDGFAASAPVGSFAPDSRGLYDLGGNVAEWVHDFHDVTISDRDRAIADPLGPEKGEHHVIRGASWAHGNLTELRLSFRDYGVEGRDDVGFRIARYLD